MPAGTSGAMAGIAASQAALAAAEAHKAEVSRCQGVIERFDSKTATVAQMQQYATCVDTVYPQPTSGIEVIVFKIAFVIALVGLVAGVVNEKRQHWQSDFGDYCMAALAGFICTPLCCAFAAGIIYGVYWLFK